MHTAALARTALGLIALAAGFAFSASVHAPTASAWSWNQQEMLLRQAAHAPRCSRRTLELSPGLYDVQLFADRDNADRDDWAEGTKWSQVGRQLVLVKRRGDYIWFNCGSYYRSKRPILQRNKHDFYAVVMVSMRIDPVPGGGGVPVVYDNGRANQLGWDFLTNSKAGTYLIGSRIYRTRVLPG